MPLLSSVFHMGLAIMEIVCVAGWLRARTHAERVEWALSAIFLSLSAILSLAVMH